MTDRDKAVELLARALHAERDFYGSIDTVYPTATALLDQLAPLLTAESNSVTAQAVKVKPLEWEEVNPGLYIAKSILGSWSRFEGHYRPPEAYGGLCRDDPASAAQADYEARILSALE